MLKKSLKTAVVTTMMMAFGSSGAFAGDGKAKIKEYVYDVHSAWATMHVTSSDGTEWDDLKPGTLQFWAHMKIDTKWPGAIDEVAVVLGNCSGNSCKSFPLLWSHNLGQRDYDRQRNFSVATSLLDNGTAGLALARQDIIDTCNQHLTPNGATKKHQFQSSLTTTFVADTDKSDIGKILVQAGDDYTYPIEIDHAKSGDFTFNVVCDPYIPGTTVGGLKMEEGDFKTTGIDLFLSTFSGATTQPNPATTCKKGRVLVRVKTSKAGPAKFKLWTHVGNGPITSEVVNEWASFDGNSAYVAEHTKWISVDKPTQVQAMAEDMVNGGVVAQSTQWKTITLQCAGTGGGKGGGLTVGNDEPMLPDLKVTGDFSYVDVGSPQCSRTGKALISFTSNRADNIHYSLDCTNGQHLSGYVKPVQVPKKGYVAAAMQTFQIDKTTVYSCALKTVQPGPVQLQKWKSHTFKCVHRAVETGPNDVQVAPKPTDDAPRMPAAADVKVAPQPTDVDAGKRRQEALEKAREAARRKAEAAKKAAAEAQRKHAEAAKKAAAEAQRKREAAKKAAELKRKREAAKKAAELKRKREAAKKAAELKRKRDAAKNRRKLNTGNAVMQSLGRR